ncbi:MAG: hypothetical protein EXR62_10655 [Chloroflexi bacterium]|nr:hypothetical protein [Chloroflexota bacterium]
MADIEKQVQIAAPIEVVWTALTDLAAIHTWMQDRTAKVDLQPGGSYTFFDGEMMGKFTEIAPPTTLAYTCRVRGWPDAWADSLVRWELAPITPQSTAVYLTHDRLPNAAELEGHIDGWDDYFLNPVTEWCKEQTQE